MFIVTELKWHSTVQCKRVIELVDNDDIIFSKDRIITNPSIHCE